MGRKEFELMFKLSSQVNGSFSGNMKSAQSAIASMQKEITGLKRIQSDVSAYQKQQQAVSLTNKELEALKQQYDNIQKEIQETSKCSSTLKNKLVAKQLQIDKTTVSLDNETEKLNQMETSLQNAGVDTAKLTEEKKRLAQETVQLREKQREAAEEAERFGEEEKRLAQETEQLKEKQREAAEEAESFGGAAAQAMDTVASAIMAAGIVNALNGIKDAYMECIQAAGEFEETMSTVEALSGASAGEIEELSEMAKQLGAETQYTAQESAEAMTYMAMAGWETTDMLNGMDGVLQLAAASGEDLGQVSDIVTDALTAFGLSASDTAHFADVLAVTATGANTSVGLMGETFKYAAPLAGALGYSVEDVATMIGLMANSGIKSTQAGTALRTMFSNLTDGATLTSTAFGEIEIETQDVNGNMRGLSEIISDLRQRFGEMTEAEKVYNAEQLVGKNAMSGFVTLMKAADGDFEKLSASINDCSGAASNMAKIKMDNMAGDLKLAQSAWEGVTIAVGEQFTPVMREVYQVAAEVFSELKEFIEVHPELVKAVTAFVAVLAAATAGMTAYAAASKVLKALDMASLFTGPAGAAMLAVGATASFVAGIVALAESSEDAVPDVEELTEAARELNDAMEEAEADYKQVSTEMMAQASAAEVYIDKLDELGHALHGQVEGSKEYTNYLQLLIRTMPELADSIDLETNAIEGGTDALRRHVDAWEQDAKAQARQEYINSLYDDYNEVITEAAENDIKLADAKLKEEKAAKEVEATQKRINTLLEEAQEESEKYYQETGILKDSSAYLSDEYYELMNSMEGYNREVMEAQLTQESLKKAIEEDNEALEAAETVINETEAALEEMAAADREAAGAAAELEEQNTSVSESVSRISTAAEELAEQYQEAYNEAYQSISGQYALWDEAAQVAEKSVGDITASMDAQAGYWQDYNTNLSSLSERTADIEGLSEVIASFADGSQESVNAIAGMADASDSDLMVMVEKWKELHKEQEEVSGSIADLKENFTQEMDKLGNELAADIEGMNLSEEAAAAAQETMQGFINGANGMLPQVQAAYENVAAAAKNALNGAAGGAVNVQGGGKAAGAGKGYASGTRSAEPGFALVGENGPEIVYMNGGETVLTASETEKVKNELSVSNREMQAAYADQAAYAESQQQEPAAAPVEAETAGGGITIVVYNNPTIVVDGEKPDDLEEQLEKNNQLLLQQLEEKLSSHGDEGRTRYE